jgi:hypothetical protein
VRAARQRTREELDRRTASRVAAGNLDFRVRAGNGQKRSAVNKIDTNGPASSRNANYSSGKCSPSQVSRDCEAFINSAFGHQT